MAIVRRTNTSVGTFVDTLMIDSADELTLRVRKGVASATIKRANGEVQSLTRMLNGKFEQRTAFDAASASPAQRRKVVNELRRKGHTQVEIARLLGVSQTTVSNDLSR